MWRRRMDIIWEEAGHQRHRNVSEWIWGYDGDSMLLFKRFSIFFDIFRSVDVSFSRLQAHLG
jgi:hypothetical protein